MDVLPLLPARLTPRKSPLRPPSQTQAMYHFTRLPLLRPILRNGFPQKRGGDGSNARKRAASEKSSRRRNFSSRRKRIRQSALPTSPGLQICGAIELLVLDRSEEDRITTHVFLHNARERQERPRELTSVHAAKHHAACQHTTSKLFPAVGRGDVHQLLRHHYRLGLRLAALSLRPVSSGVIFFPNTCTARRGGKRCDCVIVFFFNHFFTFTVYRKKKK